MAEKVEDLGGLAQGAQGGGALSGGAGAGAGEGGAPATGA